MSPGAVPGQGSEERFSVRAVVSGLVAVMVSVVPSALGVPGALASTTVDYVKPPQEVVPGLVLRPAPEPKREPRRERPVRLSPLAQAVERQVTTPAVPGGVGGDDGGSGPTGDLSGPSEMDLRMVNANILTSLGSAQFAADLRETTASSPDFVTLNEANRRSAAQLSLPGYAFHRATDSKWSSETPVMWRTDRWEKLSTGTRYLHRREGTWGVRAVNWATLRSYETGKVVSVVSAHASPIGKGTPDLIQVYTAALGQLVRELDDQGPVFVGGDLNVHITSRRYPRGQFDAAGLRTTFDVHGKPAGGTGDHGGNTIDYLLFQPGAGVTSTGQSTMELFSDHDAVAGSFHLSW